MLQQEAYVKFYKLFNRYYRGQVTGGDPDGNMLIFFIDHGERIEVPNWQVRNSFFTSDEDIF